MVSIDVSTGKITDDTLDAKVIAAIQSIPTFEPTPQEVLDFKNNYDTAVNRLKDIIANGGSLTIIQTKDAIIDLARIQLRLMLYLYDRIGSG